MDKKTSPSFSGPYPDYLALRDWLALLATFAIILALSVVAAVACSALYDFLEGLL